MNVSEACRQRKSIRAFTEKVPERSVILQCLEAACWAPNPTSQQPWKFIVLAGTSLQAVCAAIEESFAGAQAGRAQQKAPALSDEIAALLDARKQENFNEMIAYLKQHRVDMQAIGQGNFNFHRAPMAIIFGTYPCRDQNYLKSTVAAMENFMLAAAAQGLGTCWANAVSICQDAVKQRLDLHPDLILVDGIAVGYPQKEAALNSVPRHRLPVDEVTSWLD